MSITVDLPEEVASRITAEAKRRGVSQEQIAVEAIEARYPPHADRHPRRRLAFAAIGTSTTGRVAADADAILAEGFGRD